MRITRRRAGAGAVRIAVVGAAIGASVAASLVVAGGLAGSALAVPSGGAAAGAPFDTLPAGPPPTAIAYAIGGHAYFGGHSWNLSGRITAPTTSIAKAFSLQSTPLVQINSVQADIVGEVLRLSATSPSVRRIGAGLGGGEPADGTVQGLVSIAGQYPEVRRLDGTKVADYRYQSDPGWPSWVTTEGAGSKLVQREFDAYDGYRATFLWAPGATPVRLPDGYRAVGRLGGGWLGKPLDRFCWRTAPATAPLALRAPRLCSLTRPLLSADGTKAVVVQAGRVRVYDAVTGAAVSVASMPALTGWRPGTRDVVPAAWENSGSYLLNTAYDGALALVRCNVSTGACQRVVRAAVRTGIGRIVTERNADDAVPLS